MPANARPRTVLIDSALSKFVNGPAGELRHLSAKLIQEGREVLSCFHGTPRVVIAKAERLNSPVSDVTMKLERLKLQRPEPCDQGLLLSLSDHIVFVPEASGHFCVYVDSRLRK